MRNFFKGISWSQIAAGALAAVTSFLLSAKIGIAGSVIGVAVGSIVSAVASQIYRNIINASNEKLLAVAGLSPDGADGATSDGGDGADDRTRVLGDITAPSAPPAPPLGAGAGDETRVIALDATAHAVGRGRSVAGRAGDAARHGVTGTGPLERSRMRRNKRIAIVVAVASALAAVGITAGIIMAVTGGQGTDSVVRDLVSQQTTRQAPSDTDQNQSPSGDGASRTDGDSTRRDEQDGDALSGTDEGTDSSGTQQGTDADRTGSTGGEQSTAPSDGQTGTSTDQSGATPQSGSSAPQSSTPPSGSSQGGATAGSGSGSSAPSTSGGQSSNDTATGGQTSGGGAGSAD
ncbi:hypothetical protein H7U32_07570 [Bifidobacterium pullorum subsp. saeculare]|uniref:Uncharacterized protein n=1 Tax=Bifidobacterium pullorum subsp. saeculare TaxID=78257 RepID=A0A938WYX7_9BIFI|nr:hypothetical protein [Bifidobacterium pullorum]MBM6700155.1 hypothetical protein [Bifidobacterium pullorum subsp. saeculare]